MKKLFFLILIWFLCFFAVANQLIMAQPSKCGIENLRSNPEKSSCLNNFVPNNSLEEYTGLCIPYPIFTNRVPHWTRANLGSIDYLNGCDTSNYLGVPHNIFGYQQAMDGDAYCGWVTYIENAANPTFAHNFREYPMVRLSEVLVAGQKYCLTFYVSLADSSTFASNNIGAYFSVDSLIPIDSKVLPYSPQVNVTEIISDTSKWTEISAIYTATGGERFIVFGNFFPDNQTAWDSTGIIPTTFNGQYCAQYFLDNVSLCLCDDTVSTDDRSRDLDKIKVFPNPANEDITVQFPDERSGIVCTLYDATGIFVRKEQYNGTGNQYVFPLKEISSGLYLLKVTTKTEQFNLLFMKE